MNYYERHLGDYAKDTGHLSMLEHGAYTLLLDRYYSTEAGVPADQVHRITRARTTAERAAVDTVLAEFFTLADGLWTKSRVEEEIERAAVKINAAKENGKRGGRPKKNPPGYETETQQKPTGLSLGSENETQQKALQSPDTRHQEEKEKDPPASRGSPTKGSRLPVDWQPGEPGQAFAEQQGLHNGRAQAELEKFRDYWASQPGQKGVKTDWQATWRNWVRKAVEQGAKAGATSDIFSGAR